MHPVEVTRSSITNWSDIEQASLAVAIKRAADACAARPASIRNPHRFHSAGTELLGGRVENPGAALFLVLKVVAHRR
jgi:hypothetical protein